MSVYGALISRTAISNFTEFFASSLTFLAVWSLKYASEHTCPPQYCDGGIITVVSCSRPTVAHPKISLLAVIELKAVEQIRVN